jgi:hypothetical protein
MMSARLELQLAAFAFHDHTKQFGSEKAGLLVGAAGKGPPAVTSTGIHCTKRSSADFIIALS